MKQRNQRRKQKKKTKRGCDAYKNIVIHFIQKAESRESDNEGLSFRS